MSASTIDDLDARHENDNKRAYTAALAANLVLNAGWSWLFFTKRLLGNIGDCGRCADSQQRRSDSARRDCPRYPGRTACPLPAVVRVRHRPIHPHLEAQPKPMNITKLPGQVAESVLSIVGIRIGTEEPHHISTPLTDHVELRKYGPRIAAETTVVADDEDRARSIGFRRLARYIFGGNHRDQTIAMTAPVSPAVRRGTVNEIAMTAPVGQIAERPTTSWTSSLLHAVQVDDRDTLPTPDDDEVDAGDRAGRDRGGAALQRRPQLRPPSPRRTEELLKSLQRQANRYSPPETPLAWFYDPPWTLPFRRRNEIAIPVAG